MNICFKSILRHFKRKTGNFTDLETHALAYFFIQNSLFMPLLCVFFPLKCGLFHNDLTMKNSQKQNFYFIQLLLEKCNAPEQQVLLSGLTPNNCLSIFTVTDKVLPELVWVFQMS